MVKLGINLTENRSYLNVRFLFFENEGMVLETERHGDGKRRVKPKGRRVNFRERPNEFRKN